MSDKIFIGKSLASLDFSPEFDPISKVIINRDDDTYFESGDDTGRTLEFTNPWATQEMADSVLSQVSGFVYKPYSGQDALYPISSEIGDGITIGGKYSILATSEIDYNSLTVADLSAPEDEELDHEYPFESRQQKEINRENKRIYSLITKTDEEIRLFVTDEINGISSDFSVKLDSITSTVNGLDGQVSTLEQTASSLQSQIKNANGEISRLEQYVDSITLSVSNGSTSSTISLKAGSVTIASQNISMSGLVTYTGLSGGTTTIDGACIKTGTISANRLDLTGAITFSDLSTSVQNDINDAYDMARDAKDVAYNVDDTVSGWTYRGTTYIDGSMIQTGTVMASMLVGGEIRLLTDDEDFAGYIALSGASSSTYKVIYGGLGATQLVAEDGDVYIEAYGYVTLDGADGITARSDFYPSSDGRYNLGDPSFYWDNVYANTSTATSSDRNRKNTITYDMSKYSALFDALRPTPYKLNDGTSGRTHLGLIAQDVEKAMQETGISTLGFAGLIKSYIGDGNYRYALRYEEFIAMLIHEVQSLKQRVAELEAA